MAAESQTPILAVDGGGTRCRIALVQGQTVTSVETGSANVSSDFDGTVHSIAQGLDLLAAKSGLPQDVIHNTPAFVGLAGVTGPAIADRLRQALPLSHLRIEDDRRAALRGALGRQDGVLAHCGTGSFYAAQFGATAKFAGGWGPVLGDEASAQWIGRNALRLTLESVDGRIPDAPMAQRFLTQFQSPAGLVHFAATARPHEFGELAKTVNELAAEGDHLARSTMQAGADEIERSLKQIGWAPGLPVCLTGGIGPEFRAYLPTVMQDCVTQPLKSPLDGALSLARDFAEEVIA